MFGLRTNLLEKVYLNSQMLENKYQLILKSISVPVLLVIKQHYHAIVLELVNTGTIYFFMTFSYIPDESNVDQTIMIPYNVNDPVLSNTGAFLYPGLVSIVFFFLLSSHLKIGNHICTS